MYAGGRVNLPYRGRQGALLYCWGKIPSAALSNQAAASLHLPNQVTQLQCTVTAKQGAL